MEALLIRFCVFTMFVSILNLMVYTIFCNFGFQKWQMSIILATMNLTVTLVTFFSGPTGVGKDWPSFVPPLIWILIWYFVLKPKPPPRKRWRKKLKVPAKKSFGYAGTRFPNPA
ncbi:hypothetical protein BH11PAT4_BH11PAT4_4340 [soil metagenome]